MRTLVAGLVSLVLLAGTLQTARAGEPPGDSTAEPPTASQQRSRDLLLGMARFLGAQQKFSVKLQAEFDVVQDNGQKIEFGERREISVERPSRFLSTHRESDGRSDVILFDGETITVSDAGAAVHARAPQPGDIDASIVYFVRDLKMRLPVAPVLMSRFAAELENRVREVDYVETTDILGETTHHLAGRTDAVDFQVWVRDGEQPLPLRMVLSYRAEPEHPQFRVDFSDWNLEPRFRKDTFRFDPPEGSREIAFVVQLVPTANAADEQPREEPRP